MSFSRKWGPCVCCNLCFLLVCGGIACFVIFLNTSHTSSVKFYVTDAFVTKFNLTNNSNLYYSLALNITVENPNSKVAVDYRRVTVIAYYKDISFGVVNLTPFSQGHKNTTFLNALFQGQRGLMLKDKYLVEYYSETSDGAYLINVDFDLEIRARYRRTEPTISPPIISCRMKVPVVNKQASTTTKCDSGRPFFSDRHHYQN